MKSPFAINTMFTLRNVLLVLGAVAIFGGGVWMGRVEAPTPENTPPTPAPTETASTTQNTAEQPNQPETPAPTPVTAAPSPTPTPAPISKPAPTPAPKPKTTLVTYDGEYFSPREVTILEGGTVRFMNLSKEDMWVASNLHPVHSGYPVKDAKSCSGYAFDMCKAVGINGTWDFTLTRQGTFGFHNHLRPISTGKIEVNDPNEKPSIPGN
jgi:hypothetical protein